jgi:colanic acid/amylovoran biosynthesis glycosyltransferase
MHETLCVFDGQLGAPFVDVHIRGILPGATVAISRYSDHPLAGQFPPPCPVLYLNQVSRKFSFRARARLGGSRELMLQKAVRDFLKKHRVTAVMGEFLDQVADFVPVFNEMGIPYVVQGHGIDVSASLRKRETCEQYQIYRTAKMVLTRSEFHRQRLISIGLPEKLIHVNPGGIVVPQQIVNKSPGARKRFLAVGRMCPQKAPILLLESFRLALQQDPELTLDYVGWGPLASTVKQFIEARKMVNHVRLHGMVSEEAKLKLLTECGVFVQHSAVDPETGSEEGLPAAIQEAMAYGLAVVSTRHSGIAEAVVDGETGLLVAEGDIEGMSEAFLAVQSNSSSMGTAGRRRAQSLYTAEAECERLRNWIFS